MIDCQGDEYDPHRAFHFHSAETAASVVEGLTIKNGWAENGGAILCDGAAPKIVSCAFVDNVSKTIYASAKGGAIACLNRAGPIIQDCQFQGNWADQVPGDGYGGAIYCEGWSSPAITDCTIAGNTAGYAGGAMYFYQSRPIIMRCTITGNKSFFEWWYGKNRGQVYCLEASPAIVNCVFFGNDGDSEQLSYAGGAVGLYSSHGTITNCTIVNNLIDGGVWSDSADAVLTNCILWGNTCTWSAPANEQIVGSIRAVHCDVEGGWDPEPNEPANLNADPLFVSFPDANSPFAGNFYLNPSSPCVNAGSDTAVNMGLSGFTTRTDLGVDTDGVDLGYHYPRDCNGNGVPDPLDIFNCAPGDPNCADCNNNGIPDACDIAAGTSNDARPHDGVPDECQGRPRHRRFSIDADFEAGTLINVTHDPNHDQLRRCRWATPLPYLWIPASARGTVARIYTGNDPNVAQLGEVVGECLSAPDAPGANPRRTSVDLDGNVWVGNKDDADGNGTGTAVKLGLVIGGTRCDGTGRPTPFGDYLKPPFKYNTCIDRDGDGLIRTSRGLAQAANDLMEWPGNRGSVATAADECICRYTAVDGTQPRHVSVDANNDVWVGGYGNHVFNLLDGETGEIDPNKTFTLTYGEPNIAAGGYGGLVDGNGVLWTTHRTDYDNWNAKLLRRDLVTGDTSELNSPNSYAVGIDRDGNIWNTQWASHHVRTFNSAGDLTGSYDSHDPNNDPNPCDRAVAVTFGDNDVWIANSWTNPTTEQKDRRVTRLANDGTRKTTIDVGSDGYEPTGLAVDQDGRMWVSCRSSDTVKCIDPNTNSVVNTTTLSYNSAPYTYTGMTGQVALHISGSGTWNVVHDGGHLHADWHLVLLNRDPNCPDPNTPDPNKLTVEVRAADLQAGLSSKAYAVVPDGKRFDDVKGRFIEVRVRIKGSRPGAEFASPVLYDLTVSHGMGDVNCDGVVSYADINPFTQAVSNPSAYTAAHPRCDIMLADCYTDGVISYADINAFVALLGDMEQ